MANSSLQRTDKIILVALPLAASVHYIDVTGTETQHKTLEVVAVSLPDAATYIFEYSLACVRAEVGLLTTLHAAADVELSYSFAFAFAGCACVRNALGALWSSSR